MALEEKLCLALILRQLQDVGELGLRLLISVLVLPTTGDLVDRAAELIDLVGAAGIEAFAEVPVGETPGDAGVREHSG